jgi:hypothetical protein
MLEQRFFRAPLLSVLAASGGSMTRATALDALEEVLDPVLGPDDRIPLADRGTEEGWRNRVSWEVKDLKDEGLLIPTGIIGRGIWALSPSGRTSAADVAIADRGGVPYVCPEAPRPVAVAEPFVVDPDLLDRALLAHHQLVDRLASWVTLQGLSPLLPVAGFPAYDLAWWMTEEELVVAEIKTTTPANEERQLRLGLGQVLRYRQQLATRFPSVDVRAWLVVERPLDDPTWAFLCHDLDVTLRSSAELAHLW